MTYGEIDRGMGGGHHKGSTFKAAQRASITQVTDFPLELRRRSHANLTVQTEFRPSVICEKLTS
jgi:hypothetical protein